MIKRARAILGQFTVAELLRISLGFIVVYAFFFALFFPIYHPYERVAHAGLSTSGSVIATEPKNHMSIRYAYRVDGTHYEGVMSEAFLDPPRLDDFQIGQAVSVIYWPERPSVSVPTNRTKFYEERRTLLIAAPIAFGLFAAAGIALKFREAAVRGYLTRRFI